MGSARRAMGAAMLTLQAVVLFLAGLVLIGTEGVGAGTALAVGLGFAAACVVTAGLLRFGWAYYVGWLIQVAAVAFGFVVPLMFVLGVVFGALWGGAFFLGAKIDRERAERDLLEQQYAAEHDGTTAGG